MFCMRLDSAAVFALFVGLFCSACGSTPTPTAPSVTPDYSGKWSGVVVEPPARSSVHVVCVIWVDILKSGTNGPS